MASDRPKFEQGEEVILVSDTHPHMNGEYVINYVCELDFKTMHVYHPGVGCNLSFKTLRDQFVYDLDIKAENGFPMLTDERELRKKHKPSEFGFEDLMANLNSKIQEPVR